MDEVVPAAGPPPPPLASQATLAPWYHTAGIVLLLLAYAFIAHFTHRVADGDVSGSSLEKHVTDAARAIVEAPRVPLYCSTVMLSWMLLASVVAGLYHRRAFFFTMLRRRFRSRWVDPAIGLGIYLSFLSTVSLFVVLLTSVLVMRAHHTRPRSEPGSRQMQPLSGSGKTSSAQSEDTDAAGSAAAAEDTESVQRRVQHILRLNQKAVASLAPRTVPELLLWIVLSFTAGFCEEHIFRGYLLRQSTAALQRFAIPAWLAAALSVLATSVLFGSLHLYEGVGGAVIVGLLGMVFAVMTLALGNLRAVIVAHFLQDFLGGLTYYIAHLRHVL